MTKGQRLPYVTRPMPATARRWRRSQSCGKSHARSAETAVHVGLKYEVERQYRRRRLCGQHLGTLTDRSGSNRVFVVSNSPSRSCRSRAPRPQAAFSVRCLRPSVTPLIEVRATPGNESPRQSHRLRERVLCHQAIDGGSSEPRQTHDDSEAKKHRRKHALGRSFRSCQRSIVHLHLLPRIGQTTLGGQSCLSPDDFGRKSIGLARASPDVSPVLYWMTLTR